MERVLQTTLITILLLAARPAFSQLSSPYEVAPWPGFRSCAISYTFDDGCSGQFSKAIPIFDEFGYKLTLFTVTNWVGNWNNLKNAAINGHEVANHTLSHPKLDTMAIEAQKTEIKTSNDLINSRVTTQKSVTMATPYCAKGNDSLAATFFIAVRGCQGFVEPNTPGNFMNVSSVICGDQGTVKKTIDFKNKANSAASSKGWLVYLIHGVDNDGGYSPLSSDTLRQSLAYLKENEHKFWVTTFGNAARYIKERNCIIINETASTDTSLTVNIADTLNNNEIYNYPLTIRRALPAGWSQAKATQNELAITDTVIEINSVKYIQFDAVPDGGSVVITKLIPVGKKDNTGYQNKDLKIWIQNDALKIQVPESCSQNPSVTLYNIMGQQLFQSNNMSASGGLCTISPLPFKELGIYFVKLTDNRSSWSKKIQWL
jgi:peptidoglycan/xylan/chitin deacetylase (PgdA/CDA1 family)